jgi:hypothetical protein
MKFCCGAILHDEAGTIIIKNRYKSNLPRGSCILSAAKLGQNIDPWSQVFMMVARLH